MGIRFKKYIDTIKTSGPREQVRAIRVTEKNIAELVAYINRHGGAATGHNGDTRSGRPARIRLKQRNFGKRWGKLDWRVAQVGDYIVEESVPEEYQTKLGPVEFFRIKRDLFEANTIVVK